MTLVCSLAHELSSRRVVILSFWVFIKKLVSLSGLNKMRQESLGQDDEGGAEGADEFHNLVSSDWK